MTLSNKTVVPWMCCLLFIAIGCGGSGDGGGESEEVLGNVANGDNSGDDSDKKKDSDDDEVTDCEDGAESEERERFEVAQVAFGADCDARKEVQTRTCENGTWSAWTGTFAEKECAVAAPASCNGTAHDTEGPPRTMYQAAEVAHNQECVSEEQTQTCNNGQFGPYKGAFQHPTCVKLPPPPNWCLAGVPASLGSKSYQCGIRSDSCANGYVGGAWKITTYGNTPEEAATNCREAARHCNRECGTGTHTWVTVVLGDRLIHGVE